MGRNEKEREEQGYVRGGVTTSKRMENKTTKGEEKTKKLQIRYSYFRKKQEVNHATESKRQIYPFKSVNRILLLVERNSTVGFLAPICLLNILLNIWTTSFFDYK